MLKSYMKMIVYPFFFRFCSMEYVAIHQKAYAQGRYWSLRRLWRIRRNLTVPVTAGEPNPTLEVIRNRQRMALEVGS